MKSILLTLSCALASTTALAEDSLFVKYEKLAQDLATQVTLADAQKSIDTLAAKNTNLQELGSEIMNMYGEKFSECAAQYADFETKIATLPSMSVGEIHAKFHDGDDLLAAPGHCYFGRALVVHPAMSAIRLADGDLSKDDVEAVKEESIEVSFHVKTVAKRIAQ